MTVIVLTNTQDAQAVQNLNVLIAGHVVPELRDFTIERRRRDLASRRWRTQFFDTRAAAGKFSLMPRFAQALL